MKFKPLNEADSQHFIPPPPWTTTLQVDRSQEALSCLVIYLLIYLFHFIFVDNFKGRAYGTESGTINEPLVRKEAQFHVAFAKT